MSISIKSDFTDYYDFLADKNSKIIYNRNLHICKQRGSAIKFLKNIGLKTIELKQVNQFYRDDGLIVVYTDIFGHNGEGKSILDVNEAQQFYSGYLASKYILGTTTVKNVQIGNYLFNMRFENDNNISLEKGKLVDLKVNNVGFNRAVGLPIYSIDYIVENGILLATDFNEVQNLKELNIDKYIIPEQVIELIKSSLIAYNKI